MLLVELTRELLLTYLMHQKKLEPDFQICKLQRVRNHNKDNFFSPRNQSFIVHPHARIRRKFLWKFLFLKIKIQWDDKKPKVIIHDK